MFLNGEDQGVAAMDVPQVSCITYIWYLLLIESINFRSQLRALVDKLLIIGPYSRFKIHFFDHYLPELCSNFLRQLIICCRFNFFSANL